MILLYYVPPPPVLACVHVYRKKLLLYTRAPEQTQRERLPGYATRDPLPVERHIMTTEYRRTNENHLQLHTV